MMGITLPLLWPADVARAEGEGIRVVSSTVTSEFPDGLRFRAEVEGDNEIDSVAVRLRIGQQGRGIYEYLDHTEGTLVSSELLWRTDTATRYIPPGTIITYSFEVEDSQGTVFESESQEFVYTDIRFEWAEVSEGPVSVAYHGPVRSRAEIVLGAIIQTLGFMGPLLGADVEQPIRVTMYNNVKEMLAALPPGSTTIRRELITEGQAFVEFGTLLVLGGGRLATGTASHEVTHILTHRAGDSPFRRVPSWLDEGLAEFGNIDPGFSYDIALDFAVSTGRLQPITSSVILPGEPEDVIIFYGEASDIVRFMVRRFGADRMKELMAALKSGNRVEDAVEEVYGLELVALENEWRASLGAPAYVPPSADQARPTPIPRPALLPYSLTPQPSSTIIEAAVSTPTAEPTETATPQPVPTATPMAEEPVVATVVDEETEPADRSGNAASAGEGEDRTSSGGGACGAPTHGGPRSLEVSGLGLLVGLGGLWARRRLHR